MNDSSSNVSHIHALFLTLGSWSGSETPPSTPRKSLADTVSSSCFPRPPSILCAVPPNTVRPQHPSWRLKSWTWHLKPSTFWLRCIFSVLSPAASHPEISAWTGPGHGYGLASFWPLVCLRCSRLHAHARAVSSRSNATCLEGSFVQSLNIFLCPLRVNFTRGIYHLLSYILYICDHILSSSTRLQSHSGETLCFICLSLTRASNCLYILGTQ